MRSAAALLLLLAAGCGKKEPPDAVAETKEYEEWRGSQSIRQLVGGVPGEQLAGTVTISYPGDRSKSAQDFIELRLNGDLLLHSKVRTGGGVAAPFTLQISLRPGADWFDLWDSTLNRYFRFEVDTRQGTDFVLTPSAAGYDISWTKREN